MHLSALCLSNAFEPFSQHQRLGLKNRNIRIWTGWAVWLSVFVCMAWIYQGFIETPLLRQTIFATSLWKPTQASTPLSKWQLLQRETQREAGIDHLSSKDNKSNFSTHTRTDPSIDLPNEVLLNQARQGLNDAWTLIQGSKWSAALPILELSVPVLARANVTSIHPEIDAGMYALARAHAEMDQFDLARKWTDALYATDRMLMAEPAYYLCRRLRQTGQNAMAFYYYLLAKSMPGAPIHPRIPAEPGLHEYLLDYEKSILWSYVGDIAERHSRLHGLAFSTQLLEKRNLPHYIRESVFSNLQYYAPNLLGAIEVLREEKSIDDEWRYSTPTFVDSHTTLIRVVNYYVADDGSYHVSPSAGERVSTKLVWADTDEAFEVRLSSEFQGHAGVDHLVHPEAYIQGLEDTRVVRDASHENTIFTLSASEQYSDDGRVMNQVLGILDLERKTHTIDNVIHGPHPERHDKNWVFAGGIDDVVYDWYPAINIGSINRTSATLNIHTTIPSPRSFDGMRGSTNGVLYQDEWWFVTHAVIYRAGRMRKYLHRLVVLDRDLKILRQYSLPFTFEAGSDVEYCLGFKVDDTGLTFGYSVRDRSSKVMRLDWRDVGSLFESSPQ